MIVDASAILAILKSEPDAAIFARALTRDAVKFISPINWHEAAVNMERSDDFERFEIFFKRSAIVISPIDETQARLAHQAWRRFGKGRHAARLNMGDCFAYALSKASGEPLLYKGGDFLRTDVVAAV
jgi:ribonuclease VapC